MSASWERAVSGYLGALIDVCIGLFTSRRIAVIRAARVSTCPAPVSGGRRREQLIWQLIFDCAFQFFAEFSESRRIGRLDDLLRNVLPRSRGSNWIARNGT